MLIGYARVSTEDQKLRLQRDALKEVGCEKIFREKISGASKQLPQRIKLLDFARKGDVVVVWKLDRFGRSLSDLIDVMTTLKGKGVGFRSLKESIDTTTSTGRLVFHIFGALADYAKPGPMRSMRSRTGRMMAGTAAGQLLLRIITPPGERRSARRAP